MIINILYLIIASILAFGITYWMYFNPKTKSVIKPKSLFVLRFFSVLALILLLFNPKWIQNKITNQKPQLVVALDNSASIKSVKANETAIEILDKIKKNKALHDKFDVQYFSFGKEINILDSIHFNESETDISQMLNYVKPAFSFQKSPILLLTDGNATKGSDYNYYKGNNTVYPLVLGDTTQYADVFISQLNVNQYAFLDNQFPVEVFVNYSGKETAQTLVSVFENNQKIFQKSITFTPSKNVETIAFDLTASKVGLHYYTLQLSTVKGEKNTKNNTKTFIVEVVDEQAKVLIYSSYLHPDLGAIKESIEQNKQRKVDLSIGLSKNIKLSDYQMVVLYQPTSEMNDFYKEILNQNKNVWFITGSKTDWNFLNKMQPFFSKKISNLKEQYQGVYNPNFPNFILQEFPIEQLPPLQDVFGEINFTTKNDVLFFQKIGNTTLETPLLSTFSDQNKRMAVLFGEGLWQWKIFSKKFTQSDVAFDQFINSIVQFTSDSEKLQQLQIEYEKMVYSNQKQVIKAKYFDKNFQLDTRANLTLQISNLQENKQRKIPFVLNNTVYTCSLDGLKPGDYNFKVIVEKTNESKNGNFRVLDYSIEDQFINSNYQGLRQLAINTQGNVVFPNSITNTLDNLIKDTSYKLVQKSTKKITPLIDWKWLLLILIVSLSAEWFIRKYRGLI